MKQAARDWLNRTDATGNEILNGKKAPYVLELE